MFSRWNPRKDMERNYQQKTEQQKWSQNGMESAIQEVIKGRMGYSAASHAFSVPRTTLIYRVKITQKRKRQKKD
ncbi:hypothetical protein J437_LFUL014019 [Ladona fulva]|uniref:HTH psq-type domain-containing protein n=1 Tax=Ladona fulva TaxID=123851 RepID=A0A8K0KJK6_LADFU|nr:hypothetical protein J437_LFUL014019 [Ladona fulva]